MDLSISLTSEAVKLYFYDSLKEFNQSFKSNESGDYTIKLSDIQKIRKIGKYGFYHIRPHFMEAIIAKNYQLSDFLDVFILGMHLFESRLKRGSLKVSQMEKEDFFKEIFKIFFLEVFNDTISINAYLKGKREHSDTILFNSQKTSDYIFLEYAANIDRHEEESFEKPHKGKIFEHLNRIVDVYSQDKIDCFHGTNNSKLEDFKLDKVWFIYFGKNIDPEKIFKSIDYKKYDGVNLVFVSYDFDSHNFKIVSKLHNSNEYVIYPE